MYILLYKHTTLSELLQPRVFKLTVSQTRGILFPQGINHGIHTSTRCCRVEGWMNIVIVGAGDVGYNIAKDLSEDGHDIVVIEHHEEVAKRVDSELDVRVIVGNGAQPDVLAKAGVVENCSIDYLIACSRRDEVNIMACWQAKRSGVKRVISRAKSIEYVENHQWAQALGIDETISPERSVARDIEEMLFINAAVHTSELMEGKAVTYAFKVTESSPVAGMTLRELGEKHPELRFVMIYILRDEKGQIPFGDWVLEPGDLCYIITFRDQALNIQELFQKERRRKHIRRVLIVGGGKLGKQLMRLIVKNHPHIEIKIIDKDLERCTSMAEEFPTVTVLHGDGTDEKLLRHEGIELVDAFLAASEYDELNIVMGILAKSLGVGKSVALVRKKIYSQLSSRVPLDAVVNPNDSLSSLILKRIRYPETSGTLSLIGRIGAEILEITLPPESSAAGKAVAEINLPKGVLIAMVSRQGENLMPKGNLVLHGGDVLLLFAMEDRMTPALKHLEISV